MCKLRVLPNTCRRIYLSRPTNITTTTPVISKSCSCQTGFAVNNQAIDVEEKVDESPKVDTIGKPNANGNTRHDISAMQPTVAPTQDDVVMAINDSQNQGYSASSIANMDSDASSDAIDEGTPDSDENHVDHSYSMNEDQVDNETPNNITHTDEEINSTQNNVTQIDEVDVHIDSDVHEIPSTSENSHQSTETRDVSDNPRNSKYSPKNVDENVIEKKSDVSSTKNTSVDTSAIGNKSDAINENSSSPDGTKKVTRKILGPSNQTDVNRRNRSSEANGSNSNENNGCRRRSARPLKPTQRMNISILRCCECLKSFEVDYDVCGLGEQLVCSSRCLHKSNEKRN